MVRIVRELDRYHGFAAAQRRLPEPPRSEALVGGTATYGAAFVCQATYEPQRLDDMNFDSVAFPSGQERLGAFAGDDRPENPTQSLEKVGSAPGSPGASLSLSPRSPGQEPGEGEGWPGASAGDDRLENPAQSLEKVESAPGDSLAPRSPGQEPGEGEGWPPDLIRGPGRLAAVGARPENPAQPPEKMDSAPETGWPAEAAPAAREAAFDGPMILAPTGWKPATMRMLQNGVAT